MAYFNEFPHTRFYDADLGWIIKKIGMLLEGYHSISDWEAEHKEEYERLYDQVQGLVNNLVDVIVPWDSSIAYEIYSIVNYQGSNYIAVQPVPVGVMITNTDYWQEANTIVEQINAIGVVTTETMDKVEEVKDETVARFATAADLVASTDLKAGNVVKTAGYYEVNDGGGAFYYITDEGTPSYNILETANGMYAILLETKSVNVDILGAHGDGETDDADVINYALENYDEVQLSAGKNYYIRSTIRIPYGKTLIGNSATITAAQYSLFADLGVTGLPQKVAIFVEGREPIANSEQAGYTKKISGFKLYEDGKQADGTGTTGFVGIYAGYKTALSGTNSKVNYSVYGYSFEDILIYGFDIGFYEAEVWQGKFLKMTIRNFKTRGLKLAGQSVNNYYSELEIDGRGVPETWGIELNVSPNYANRPEGNMFNGVGVFSCERNVSQQNALSTQITGSMLDLAMNFALDVIIGDMLITDSWLGSRTGAASLAQAYATPTVRLQNVGVADAGNRVSIVNCNIVNANNNNAEYPIAVAQGFGRYADIVNTCRCQGSVRQTNSAAAFFIYNNTFCNDNDTIYTLGNGVRSGNYNGKTGAPLT